MQTMCQTSITIQITSILIVNLCVLILNYNGCIYGVSGYRMCPRGCECDDTSLRTVCGAEAELNYVPHTLNPGLKELLLSDNHIRGIKSSLAVYKNLLSLDISNNTITSLEENNFSDNSQMKILILNKNELTAISNNTFKGLSNLVKLELNYNNMEELNALAFQHLIRLEILHLSHNKINFISRHAFKGLQRLKSLNLRANQLNLIPYDALFAVPNLLRLDLGLNFFTNVSNDAFLTSRQLEELFLDSCVLNVIEPIAFKALTKLLILRIQDNKLEKIPTKALSDLKLLEELHIGRNGFTTIEANAFSNLQHLRTLKINDSQSLSLIDKEAFNGLKNLERIELTHNKLLSRIDPNIFKGLPNLHTIIIRSNAFTTLQLNSVVDLNKPIFLDVRDNPFTCNCSLEWLKSYLSDGFNSSLYSKHNKTVDGMTYSYNDFLLKLSEVYCESPPALKNKLIITLDKDEIGCFVLETKVPIIIAIFIGVLLTCGVIIIFAIRCKYRLAGLVKNQWFSSETSNNTNTLRNDLNYRKPDFVFIPNIDLNVEESNRLTVTAIEDAVRYPLKMTPMTEL